MQQTLPRPVNEAAQVEHMGESTVFIDSSRSGGSKIIAASKGACNDNVALCVLRKRVCMVQLPDAVLKPAWRT